MSFLIGINDLMKFPLVEMMAWLWLPPLPSLKKENLGARCGILTCGLNHLQRCSKDHHLLCLGCTPFRPVPARSDTSLSSMEAVFKEFGNFVIRYLYFILLKKAVDQHGDHTPEDLLDFGIGGLHPGLPVTFQLLVVHPRNSAMERLVSHRCPT